CRPAPGKNDRPAEYVRTALTALGSGGRPAGRDRGGVEPRGERRERRGRSRPAQRIDRFEQRNIGPEGRELAKEKRQLSIARERGGERPRSRRIHVPRRPVGGNGFETAE